MKSSWPLIKEEYDFEKQHSSVENLKEIIVGIRNVRSKMNIHPTKKSDLLFVSDDTENILSSASFIKKLGFGENVKVYSNKTSIPNNTVCVVAPNMEVYLPLSELIDKDEELERINKEREKLSLELTKLSSMLNNQGFLTKAPTSKVEEIKIRTNELETMISNLDSQKESIINM